MFSKIFGTTGRQSAPILETPRGTGVFRQLMGAPGEGANAKEQTSLTEKSRKEILQQKLTEFGVQHEPEPEHDPVEDQEDMALIKYMFTTKPHLLKQAMQELLEDKLAGGAENGDV